MDLIKNPWTVLGEKKIYDNPWISVTEFDVLTPGGRPGIYGKVHFKNFAVGAVAIDAEGMIPLVGQYRFPLQAYSWEIPEGGGQLDIDPLVSAQRELREETGLVARHWQEILRMHLSNSVSDELAILYLATGLTQESPEPEDTEQLTHRRVTVDEAYDMVMRGEITDAMSVAGIMQVKLLMLQNRLTLP
jgi:8-oxo-dGTP pyrophosphatase MutT (NUDIX family)